MVLLFWNNEWKHREWYGDLTLLRVHARVLSDMQMLNIVTRTGRTNEHLWTLSEHVRDLIQRAELYRNEKELEREKPFVGARVRINEKGKIMVRKMVKL